MESYIDMIFQECWSDEHHIIPFDECKRELLSDLRRNFFFWNRCRLGTGYSRDFKDFCESACINRIKSISNFLRKVGDVAIGADIKDIKGVEFLGGDSHNGGRPIKLVTSDGAYVVKRTEKKCYQVFGEILNFVLKETASKHEVPMPINTKNNDWQILPYLGEDEEDVQGPDVKNFGYIFGVNMAVAYAINLTDIHLENVIVSRKKPYIIDAECIFYNFYSGWSENVESRALSTGLIAKNRELSALYGGASPVKELDFYEDDEGGLGYGKRRNVYRNRLVRNEHLVEPREYGEDIIRGFSIAYECILKEKDNIIEKIKKIAKKGFQTRFLVRSTAHYKATIDMLFSPGQEGHSERVESIIDRFSQSSGIMENIPINIIEKEVEDMLLGDVPYFSIDESGLFLKHSDCSFDCAVQYLSFSDRLEKSFSSLDVKDVNLLKKIIRKEIFEGGV